jgi:hypothetical protein
MGDEQLSCMQLASEIQEAHEFERNAQKKMESRAQMLQRR